MPRRSLGILLFVAIAALMFARHGLLRYASAQTLPTKSASQPIACAVLETFDQTTLGVRTIIFHQGDKADGPRLGSLLSAHSGALMELQAGGRTYRTTVFRIKSCFGRGLVMIPIGKLDLRALENFNLRLAADH